MIYYTKISILFEILDQQMLPVSETDIEIVFNIYMKHIVKEPLEVAPIPMVRVSGKSSYQVNFIDFIQELKSTNENVYQSIPISYFNEIQDAFHNVILNLKSRIMPITNVPDDELDEIHRIVERLYDEYRKTHLGYV
jgi:hypothetical protein